MVGHDIVMKNAHFLVTILKSGQIKSIVHPEDPYQMNWAEGTANWGTVKSPEGLRTKVLRAFMANGTFKETYLFTNETDFEMFTKPDDIAVYATFNDNYQDAKTCMTNRCHTHIWCGEESSYVMALRMSGAAPHLGLVLTKGSLYAYSVERDLSLGSNDRGDFLLHPSPFFLSPGETYTLEWELFWHQGKRDFYNRLKSYPSYIHVETAHYTVLPGEPVDIAFSSPGSPEDFDGAAVYRDGVKLPISANAGRIWIHEPPDHTGEYRYKIQMNGSGTHCRVAVLPALDELVKARCRFIAEKQQFHKQGSRLDGAYLVYDNEEKFLYYSHAHNDHNGGRERLGMGILLARYLQNHTDKAVETSLKKYTEYVLRELFDEDTGTVYNDISRNNDLNRLYNYPWMATFFMELYRLYADGNNLRRSVKAIYSFYENGGFKFYPIELPMHETIRALGASGQKDEKRNLLRHFRHHAEFIRIRGTDYPSHEVNYEQSIVAPAAALMLQMYRITGEKIYLDEAKKHLDILELFNGLQPDFQLYETAIRHWDGYWFGKNQTYGDTFPHYWSALTGNVYADYAEATGFAAYRKKAEASFRGVLNLFCPDGSATCARLFPLSVNGKPSRFSDPWANDQDWGLYFMLRFKYK